MSEPKYKWVPVEATHEIIYAMAGEDGENWDQWMPPKHYEALYRVGIAAAPSPPQDPRDEVIRVAREALGLIKKKCCGEARPAWDASLQTTVSRGYVADVCDTAEYKIKELMGEKT